MDEVDVVIAGAGVVGLAIARTLAIAGREVLVLEAQSTFGTGISARNSEVIHAGIYYPRGSLKARLCVTGREQLYAYCEAHGVPYQRCGKLIVATAASQLGELQRVQAAAAANGVVLEMLSADQARALEPALSCIGALHSPATGIVDSHAYMLALLGETERHGATLVCDSKVTRVRVVANGVEIDVASGASAECGSGHASSSERIDNASRALSSRFRARLFINSAGLCAPALAASMEGFPTRHVPRAYFAKGSYFTLTGRSPFSRLIYPVPEPGGLGTHLTLDLAGRARFGPDVEWCEGPAETLGYDVNPARAERFYDAVRRYWPALKDSALEPAYAGIRPKLSGPGEPAADFRIEGPGTHGVPGVVNLFGIESPGLTASLAIADQVLALTCA